MWREPQLIYDKRANLVFRRLSQSLAVCKPYFSGSSGGFLCGFTLMLMWEQALKYTSSSSLLSSLASRTVSTVVPI